MINETGTCQDVWLTQKEIDGFGRSLAALIKWDGTRSMKDVAKEVLIIHKDGRTGNQNRLT